MSSSSARAKIAAVLLVTLGSACSDARDDAAAATPDAGAGEGDSGTSTCSAPAEAPAWLEPYLGERVSKLAGQGEIAPGVLLRDRASAERRDAARTYLAAELSALGMTVTTEDYGGGANVVGRLPAIAADATEWIVVGAHFDSVPGSPGANDNASGVAAVLGVARLLADLPCRTRGVMFVMFDQEEIGLLGSKAFATREAEAKTAIVAVHTIDQVGWDADGDRRFELELPTPELFAEYEASAAEVGAAVVQTTTPSSDHQSFRSRGFPAVGITEEYRSGDTTPHAHRALDTATTIDGGYQALAARMVAHVVARELGTK